MPTTPRIGFATGYDPALPVRAYLDSVREADALGWEMAFFSETIALTTERLALGCTQVVRLRTPVNMAQTAAALDELSGGRLVLCPGACTALHAERHSLAPIDPPLALTEYVEAVRLLLTGERISYAGKVVTLTDIQLGWKPVGTRVPLWIAATSATGLRLAGRIGDGVLLNTVASPEYSANAIRIVREAVEAAGREWRTFEVAQIINTSVEDDYARALDAVRWEVATSSCPASSRPRRARGCAWASLTSTSTPCPRSTRPSTRAAPRASPAPSRRRGSRRPRQAGPPTRPAPASSATAPPA